MTDTIEGLRNKIERAADLESVVSTMKALAASNIGQYERAAHALSTYNTTVEMGLLACLRQQGAGVDNKAYEVQHEYPIGAVVFGSDQGLVGRFNDVLSDFVAETLLHFQGKKTLWAVGERMHVRLQDMGLPVAGFFEVPNSMYAVTQLVGQILSGCQTPLLYIFHNRQTVGPQYEPVRQRLLPLDRKWKKDLMSIRWPSSRLPEVLGDMESMLKSLIGEYLFVSLFRACAESLASENASRLAAMQRAEKNINEMIADLTQNLNRLRQNTIDSELFDVVSGFEAFRKKHDYSQ